MIEKTYLARLKLTHKVHDTGLGWCWCYYRKGKMYVSECENVEIPIRAEDILSAQVALIQELGLTKYRDLRIKDWGN